MPSDWTVFGFAAQRGPYLDVVWFRCIYTASDAPEWLVGVVDTDKPRIIYSCFGSKLISKTGKLSNVTVEHSNVEISAKLRAALVKAVELVVNETRVQPRPKWTATYQVYYFNVNGAEGHVINPQPESQPGKVADLAQALRDFVRQGTPVTPDQEKALLQICHSIEK